MIRRMQKTDRERVADIWIHTNIKAHSFIPEQYWRDHLETVKEMLLQAEVYVHKEENEIQGFVGLTGDYIAGIFVCSEAQSCGIGRQLLEFVKERKKQLYLSVYQKNVRAVKFYKREGFEIQCEDIDEDTGEKEYSMVWKPEKAINKFSEL